MSDYIKVLLVAVNSKYIHSNTAVYYLLNVLINSGVEASVECFSVNEDKRHIVSKIIAYNPEVVCFSCYIWNIGMIHNICSDIRKIKPHIKILLGGPEVSFETEEVLRRSGVECIIRGEGETVIAGAVEALIKDEKPNIKGCAYIIENKYIDNGYALTENLDLIPSPYNIQMLEKEKGRLIYFESSRGCPFNCIYCLSSTTKGVRNFSLERVFMELDIILEYNPSTIKFTDRSFNIDENRTIKIFEYLMKKETETCFHLEIFPSGLTEYVMEKLVAMPHGRVQIEAGIQSVNEKTLKKAGRYQDSAKALSNMKRLIDAGNTHVHLDLIAGLPGEDHDSFMISFNKTMDISPHMLQIGFLKLLKGTKARKLEGYIYEDSPPYEVLSNPELTFNDLVRIKSVSECVDLFYNTGFFKSYFTYMHARYKNTYMLYDELSEFMRKKGYSTKGISRDNKYRVLFEFSEKDIDAAEFLRFDYLSAYKSKKTPSFLGGTVVSKENIFRFLKNNKNLIKYMPRHKNKSPKELFKLCNIGTFCFSSGKKTYLFDYREKSKVTGLYRSRIIRDLSLCLNQINF